MSHRSLMLRRAVAATLTLAGVVAAPVVGAQESAETLGAIIVTAQKREQNLQDVPIVVTAVSEELLHDAGVKDIKELTVLTPGLTVTSTGSEASTTARIRGVGTVGDNAGLESSVGVVIDGVYRPRNGVSFGDLGDMERVEILKGPQGTLFGKNTSAGVINVVTKKPTFDPSSTVEVTGGNYGAFEVSASLNGGLVDDVVAARLFAAIRERDGFLKMETAGGANAPNENNDRDFYTVRAQLQFNLGDNGELRVVGDATERDEQCCASVKLVNGATLPFVDLLAPGPGTLNPPDPFARIAHGNRGFGQYTKDRGLSAEFTTEFGDVAFTSISAGRDWLSIRGQDIDYTTADIWYRDNDGKVSTQFRQLSEEIRLSGETGRLNWLAGVFYAKEKLTAADRVLYGSAFESYVSLLATASWRAAEVAAGNPTPPSISPTQLATWAGMTFGTLYPTGTGFEDKYEQVAESYAVFTNNSFAVTDSLEVTVGARYTSETKDLVSYHWNRGGNGSTACGSLLANVASIPASARTAALGLGCGTWADPAFNSLTLIQSLDESEVTGTGKVAYRFNDAVMVYASYARGYKAGGFNLDRERSTFATVDRDKSFPAEFVDSIELGTKTTLIDGALYLNATAFDQVFENFQLNTFLGTSFAVTAIKEVQSQGIDLDLIYRSDFGLGIQAGVTWSETEITDYGSAASVVVANRENDRLGFAPVVSASLAISHRAEFGDFALRSSVSAKYNSSYNTGSNLDPRKIQDAYTLVNARIGFGSADDMWALELWGQNVTDEEYVQVAFDTPPSQGGIDAFLGAPRTYGASVILKF